MSKRQQAAKPRRLRNRLGQILKDRKMVYQDLANKSGVSVKTIGRIVRQEVDSLDIDTITRICLALEKQPGEIFFVDLPTIWSRAMAVGQVSTHIASGVCSKCNATSAAGAADGCREAFGRWDVLAAYAINALAAGLAGVELDARFHSRAAFPTASHHSGVPHFVRDGRVHIIFGSPASNPLAEEVIAREIYGVPAGVPAGSSSRLGVFPYELVFPKGHVVSAFSRDGELDECGIIETRTGELVARRTFVARNGSFSDCALLITMRTKPQRLDLNDPSKGEGLIICCCGHSGPATLACARLISDIKYAAELFPEEVEKPIMRVVTARYVMPNAKTPADNRELTGYQLLA